VLSFDVAAGVLGSIYFIERPIFISVLTFKMSARVLGSTYFARKAEFRWVHSSDIAARVLGSTYFSGKACFRSWPQGWRVVSDNRRSENDNVNTNRCSFVVDYDDDDSF